MYRYIGNKSRLLQKIITTIRHLAPHGATVADLMCGTGTVAEGLRASGYRVIASDIMTYAVHHARVRLLLSAAPAFASLKLGSYDKVLEWLQARPGHDGFFFREYSPGGEPKVGVPPRKYFASENARKIDTINKIINEWQSGGKLSENEHALLRHDLILAANRVANIAGTYGHYRSSWNRASLAPLRLKPSNFLWGYRTDHVVMQGRAEELAASVSADVAYLDPPYMKRQYAANYHLIETLARGDEPLAIGVSGLRAWRDQYSNFCTKTKIIPSFEDILSKMNCRVFVLSYSEDGLLKKDQLLSLLQKYGDVECREVPFNRFRSTSSNLGIMVKEYLFVVNRTMETKAFASGQPILQPLHVADPM